jgi:hypothetical protein
MTVLLIHVMATWYMMGVIWFVQVVHYPLMKRVGEGDYDVYQAEHMKRTTWVVGPGMVVEALTGVWLLYVGTSMVLWVGLGLLLVIWVSTVLLQVPRHNRLLQRFDTENHVVLVQTNWIRTIAWTVRGLLGFWMLKTV